MFRLTKNETLELETLFSFWAKLDAPNLEQSFDRLIPRRLPNLNLLKRFNAFK